MTLPPYNAVMLPSPPLTKPSADYRPDPDDDILKPQPQYPWEMPIVTDERVPLGEIWLAHPGSGRIDKIVNLNRECGQGAVGGCELGLGHSGPCLGFGPRGEYLVWEHGTGRLLREI